MIGDGRNGGKCNVSTVSMVLSAPTVCQSTTITHDESVYDSEHRVAACGPIIERDSAKDRSASMGAEAHGAVPEVSSLPTSWNEPQLPAPRRPLHSKKQGNLLFTLARANPEGLNPGPDHGSGDQQHQDEDALQANIKQIPEVLRSSHANEYLLPAPSC
jgi:hypothetical protein